MTLSRQFLDDANAISFDLKHRNTIRYNMSKYKAAVEKGKNNYCNLELAREKAAYLKRKMLSNWSKYLIEFETNFEKQGWQVHWAESVEQSVDILNQILLKHKPEYIMKSKSMTTEEVHLNEEVEKIGITPIETDLGEFIVQIAGEKPYHILTPAMHKSKEDVAALFHEKFDLPEHSTPEEITKYVREYLRKKFFHLKVGITGANFLVAETGSVCLTENEGNGLMTTAFPDVHIVITGIEKVIPALKDLATFWPIVAQAGTGQRITVYNSIFTGTALNKNEEDGPREMHIILLDNGRTDLYSTDHQFEALSCIRCGACLNACPIYQNVGGYTYNTVYSGPIGSVITPHMQSQSNYSHLSFACSLCGKCKEVCPVKIDLPELLLLNRKESKKTTVQKLTFSAAQSVLASRTKMDFVNGSLKNAGIKMMGNRIWGEKRNLPKTAQKSFSQQYKNRKK